MQIVKIIFAKHEADGDAKNASGIIANDVEQTAKERSAAAKLRSYGLGDTIRVSLTEDPELEYQPCNRLAELAAEKLSDEAKATTDAVPSYVDKRDVTLFTRQRGRLPEQRESDRLDYRGLLHRDGSVLSAIDVQVRV